MSDEAAFLATLAASPADDTARLVYADWLDEQGRPTEAAYLRAVVACAAAGGAVPESLIDLAEQLPRDWRLRTAARFALGMEWRESGRKLHAIKLVRELTWMGLAEAKAFVEGEPDGSFFLITAEDADGIVRHHGSTTLTVRAEVESLLGRREPSSGMFTVSAYLAPAGAADWDGQFGPEPRAALRVLAAAALGISLERAWEQIAEAIGFPAADGLSLRRAHTELSRLITLLPPADPRREWDIRLSLQPRIT